MRRQGVIRRAPDGDREIVEGCSAGGAAIQDLTRRF